MIIRYENDGWLQHTGLLFVDVRLKKMMSIDVEQRNGSVTVKMALLQTKSLALSGKNINVEFPLCFFA